MGDEGTIWVAVGAAAGVLGRQLAHKSKRQRTIRVRFKFYSSISQVILHDLGGRCVKAIGMR